MADLLVEIFGEEIPARMQSRAINDFQTMFERAFAQNNIEFDSSTAFVTPRRMVLYITGLPLEKPEITEEKRGPRVDAPQKAIDGFLSSNQITRDQCEERETPKGKFLFAMKKIPATDVKEVIKTIIKDIVFKFPWPKSMRFGESKYSWVRPMHNGICLFDGKPVEFALDFRSGDFTDFATAEAPTAIVRFSNITHGHRVHGKRNIEISSFADYKQKMQENFVVLDTDMRKAIIKEQATKALQKIDKTLTMVDDKGLLEEVAGLVEYPVMLVGKIKDRFMSLPPELLRNSMKVHQKYFAVQKEGEESLEPYFIVATNIMAKDGGVKSIDGYERVLSARFADAEFFFEQDKSKQLEDYLPKLSQIKFHEKLGNMEEKSIRLENIARFIADHISVSTQQKEDAARAAFLSKCDLVTEMVFEFPELQGIMGGYYAKASKEREEVAKAIYDHYSPKGAADKVPESIVSRIVSLSDKLDTLVGFFAVGIKPTGSGDPFALRRCALGIIRILQDIDNDSLIMPDLFAKVFSLYADSYDHISIKEKDKTVKELTDFVKERLKVYLLDGGYSHSSVDAVLENIKEQSLFDTMKRLSAVSEFLKSDAGDKLTQVFKRSFNIVSQSGGCDHKADIDESLLAHNAEKKLYQNINDLRDKFKSLKSDKEYVRMMQELSSLSPILEEFFDNVTVNDSDSSLKNNRISLLCSVVELSNNICDLSKID